MRLLEERLYVSIEYRKYRLQYQGSPYFVSSTRQLDILQASISKVPEGCTLL
jgi:hypothetical protein